MLLLGWNWLGILINPTLIGGYSVKYPQSLTGIILMYVPPHRWIEDVTEINQTFPNIPVPKEYVSIYCDLQKNNPILVYLSSEFPTQGLRLFVIWPGFGGRMSKLNVWRFSRWNLCLPTCTYQHHTQYSYFLIGCFNKLFPWPLSSFIFVFNITTSSNFDILNMLFGEALHQ